MNFLFNIFEFFNRYLLFLYLNLSLIVIFSLNDFFSVFLLFFSYVFFFFLISLFFSRFRARPSLGTLVWISRLKIVFLAECLARALALDGYETVGAGQCISEFEYEKVKTLPIPYDSAKQSSYAPQACLHF
jgi:hypothetical protein